MLSFKYKSEDKVNIDGEFYKVDAAFDVLLRVIDLTTDETLPPDVRVSSALVILLGTEVQQDRHFNTKDNYVFLDRYTIDDRAKILSTVLEAYVDISNNQPVDRLGNPMPIVDQEEEMELLDFDYDAEDIYASFMQAYGMDLVEQQGKLHWFKFKALLNGLPDDTAIKKIISIRAWTPQTEKKSHTQQMREAQQKVKIPDRKQVNKWQQMEE